jgi:hypothetical protein
MEEFGKFNHERVLQPLFTGKLSIISKQFTDTIFAEEGDLFLYFFSTLQSAAI